MKKTGFKISCYCHFKRKLQQFSDSEFSVTVYKERRINTLAFSTLIRLYPYGTINAVYLHNNYVQYLCPKIQNFMLIPNLKTKLEKMHKKLLSENLFCKFLKITYYWCTFFFIFLIKCHELCPILAPSFVVHFCPSFL